MLVTMRLCSKGRNIRYLISPVNGDLKTLTVFLEQGFCLLNKKGSTWLGSRPEDLGRVESFFHYHTPSSTLIWIGSSYLK